MFVNAGACTALVAYINDSQGSNRLPGIMALGYIAARAEVFAKAVIDAKGIAPLVESAKPDYESHVRCAAAWTLGQIGHHSPEHAKAVAEANGLTVLVEAFSNNQSSDDLKVKAKKALKVRKCKIE
jgi:HEAT repeat protein